MAAGVTTVSQRRALGVCCNESDFIGLILEKGNLFLNYSSRSRAAGGWLPVVCFMQVLVSESLVPALAGRAGL